MNKSRASAASFPVRSGRSVDVFYAKPRDLKKLRATVRSWERFVRRESSPVKIDAAELGNLAFRRWREGLAKRRVAKGTKELLDHIQDNPYAEVAVLLFAQASWVPKKPVIGLCHFRRTWCNNLFLDFLAVDPSIAGEPESPFGGLGSGLLYQLAAVARQIHARVIWGEATQNSVRFYRRLFDHDDIEDLIYLEEIDYTSFQTRLEGKWRSVQ